MALEVFYSYSHKDEALRDELEKHLMLLSRQGLITSWHDRRIGAGDEWRDQIDAHVHSAHIILLLISADFLASDYCYDVEMKRALERHTAHEAVVIPIILRPVEWSGAPFAHLQALPRNAKPLTAWPDRDEAFVDVARSIREIVLRFGSPGLQTSSGPTPLVDGQVPRQRVLDAAIPSQIVKDLATELLVLIHLPESAGLCGVLLADQDAEATPEEVRSAPFKVTFPLGPDGKPEPLKASVNLTSPDFHPPSQTKNLFIPPDADSEVLEFLLTPTRTGQLKVLVELQWEEALRGSRRLRTECVAEAASAPPNPQMNLVRMPVDISVGRPLVPPGAAPPTRPGQSSPGEFTLLFRQPPQPAAPAPAAAAPPPVDRPAPTLPQAAGPGEITRMFETPMEDARPSPPRPVAPPPPPPRPVARPAAPPMMNIPKSAGEATMVFSGLRTAPQGATPAPPPMAAPASPKRGFLLPLVITGCLLIIVLGVVAYFAIRH